MARALSRKSDEPGSFSKAARLPTASVSPKSLQGNLQVGRVQGLATDSEGLVTLMDRVRRCDHELAVWRLK